ncbi:multicopper oxidase family protein [Bacillus spongiae]|uniref:Multicopper oxidase family protein n=1 Tax=Bacillus spongiae TaxID=2683610 RepID=A0ABU8HGI1_9BACI
MKWKGLGIISLVLFGLAACSEIDTMKNTEESTDIQESKEPIILKEDNKNEFMIVANERKHTFTKNSSIEAWTFNGSVPGSQIRLKQGEEVKIHLKNELPDPITIHWHGITVNNNMDGIPGVTQNAVQPGDTYTYRFTPEDPGTYMYHTHQDGVNQMDKGLAGSLIVEPQEAEQLDRDYTLVLDEWNTNSDEKLGGMMEGMMEGMMGNMDAYDMYTINGKTGESIKPLEVKEGEKVRIRLVNVGFMSHAFHLHGHEYKIVAVDGQKINEPKAIENKLISVAPGERYDIEFTADNSGDWYLERHGNEEGTENMKIQIKYKNATVNEDRSNQQVALPHFDYTSYGEASDSPFALSQVYDVEYTMDLNTEMKNHEMAYTINGKTFPNTENIQVKEGEKVKVTLRNNSMMDDHPMHLHGHFFQIISKNGKLVEGSPIIKDTVNLTPGDEYVIAFEADNPGDWLFHCHDLHHASAGMVNMVKYDNFQPDFELDPNANNKPE